MTYKHTETHFFNFKFLKYKYSNIKIVDNANCMASKYLLSMFSSILGAHHNLVHRIPRPDFQQLLCVSGRER